MPKKLSIMMIAGETSGDLHAAKLVRALRDARPDVVFEFFGSAGPKMREAGVEAIVRADELAIVGLLEIVGALPVFVHAYRKLKETARIKRPDIVILVDFPEFNLRIAKALKKEGLTIVYYISPQLWAWRKGRAHIVKKYVDLMLTILPFELEWYARHGVSNVEYVGSPVAREVHPHRDKAEFCREHGLDLSLPLIAMLPGSRTKEISRILPVMLDTAEQIRREVAGAQFVIALAAQKDSPAVASIMARARDVPDSLRVIIGETFDVLNAADVAAVASGTATLEAGIIGTPMAVVYKTSQINYSLFEPMIDVEHYGLINLIAGKRIASELIQHDFTPDKLKHELMRLLERTANEAARKELQLAANKLGHGGASKRAAEAILQLIGEPPMA